MPKVLRIINRFNLGGPTYNVTYLSKYMSPEFETLLVGGKFSENEGSSDYIVKKHGLHPIIIPEMQRPINYKNDYIAYQKIKKIIKRWQPDIVHTHASKAGVLGRIAARNLDVPVILHTFHGHIFHSYFSKTKTTIFKRIERNLARKTSQIIALSDIQKSELTQKHKITTPDQCSVIPLGFDLDPFQIDYESKRANFRNYFNIEDDVISIGIVGRLVPVKNHKMFLNAIAKLKAKSNKKIEVYIIGDGELKDKLIQQSKDLKLTVSTNPARDKGKDINFTSWIREIDWAFSGIDIACLTSFNEGTPVSLIEAQAANTPIITTDVGGIENVVSPDITALLSENDNVSEFSDNLIKLVENPEIRVNMANNGWNFVKEKFHYKRLVEDMKSLYYSLLS